MGIINEYLKKIKEAVYGEEVRSSIHDAIEQCYKDATGHPESVAATVRKIVEVSTNLSKETADRKAEVGIERKRIDNLVKDTTDNVVEYKADNFLMSCKSDAQASTTETALNVFKNISSKSENLGNFITISSNSKIQIKKSGLYSFDCKVQVTGVNASTGRQYARLKINDVQKNEYMISLIGETDEEFTNFIVSLNEGDTISFTGESDFDDTWITLYTTIHILDYDGKVKIPDITKEVSDIRVGEDGTVYGTAGEAVRKQIGNLTEDIAEISEVDETDNKYNPFSDECIDESYLQIFDIIEDTRLKISNKIHVKKGDIVRFIKNSFTNKNAGAIYNTNGLPQVSIYSNGYTEETWNDYVICASVSPIDGYYLVNMEKRGDATVNMIFVNKSFPADGKFVPYHRERLIRKSCIEKYIEPFGLTANVLNGNYEEVYSNIPLSFNKVDGYYNKNGKFFANEGYEEAVVDVKKGEKYYLTSYNYFQIARAFFRDSSGTFVGSVYTANNNKLEENTEVAIPENAVTMHLQRLTNKRVELLGKTGYELIARVNEVSPLYGKKLVTAGDSYTHASFSGNYAEYDGKNYGYYVAKRHGMTFINSGMSGSIMALDKDYVANPTSVPITSRNPFSYQRYLDVPEDTDYLTIWFGINDNAHTNLGTIDDATNETFYGAWNKVLRYYLTNRPFMKVGLIVTVGASERYRQAIRDVAKKWGYPYLDWVNDDSIPAFFDRTGMSDEARTLRRQAYGYNDFSAHPNPQFHEYVSTIYEKFLLSL